MKRHNVIIINFYFFMHTCSLTCQQMNVCKCMCSAVPRFLPEQILCEPCQPTFSRLFFELNKLPLYMGLCIHCREMVYLPGKDPKYKINVHENDHKCFINKTKNNYFLYLLITKLKRNVIAVILSISSADSKAVIYRKRRKQKHYYLKNYL